MALTSQLRLNFRFNIPELRQAPCSVSECEAVKLISLTPKDNRWGCWLASGDRS